MQTTEERIIAAVAAACGLPAKGVGAAIRLLDDGATVPFISRYRKEQTGSLDEVQIRAVETALRLRRELEARRSFVLEAISAAGALTDRLAEQLANADSLTEIEDIYAPFKPRKRTRATIAREKGLEPLARIIMAGNTADCRRQAARFTGQKGVVDADEALSGAADIIAEWASESARLRNICRNTYRRTSEIVCQAAKGKDAELEASPFAMYAAFSCACRRISSHQYLAMRRAEAEGLLKVRFALPDSGAGLDEALCRGFVPKNASDDCADIISSAVRDASKRLLRPSVENEISASLKDEADRVAIDIFADNLRQLLLASPLKGHRILAIDPGYRTGCKVVALDSQGNLLEDSVIYPTAPRCDTAGAESTLRRLIARHKLDVVALGNGTASRETEKFIKDSGLLPADAVYMVSENGASVYSASEIAREEFPDKDVTVRGAVSIGRRLIDPLAELVKIDPKSIGVGQYQHDVDQSRLKEALDYTVMSCVNAVGVDVNTASQRLLSYVSGIGPALAANIVSYRAAHGDFSSRRELRKVPRLGDKAFELAAGFLRISGGDEPLDNTGIHPESYNLVAVMARSIGVKPADLSANPALIDKLNLKELADKGCGGLETMTDIAAELRKPGRDPRLDGDNSAFVPAAGSFEELCVGMRVPGIVNNITAFGAFVDLGIKENGLIHISQLSQRRVSAVSDVLKLGQRVEARIVALDTERRRISLSLKDV
ncbi:MAG: RNA-binding transcriptional accessory protein [Muribaculaceae bacterium]|nr:RNA-binding transcriptional accessory protein [Muribaculaceae bacterium]